MSQPIVPMLIGPKWIEAQVEEYGPVHNPSTGEVIGRTPLSGPEQVDQAVQAGQRAFAHWSRVPAPDRARVMFRYRELLEEQFDAIARLICRENGKTLDEARGDMRRGLEVVEFACGIAHLGKGEHLPQLADGIDGTTMREPIGVCAGITPFNFPAMVPMWMYPIAIACGNTFVLKPSEKVPLTANLLGEVFLQAGLPEGVFNIVHGGREVVDALCTHAGISSVSFVGSSPVAKHVYELGTAHGKRVQAAGGAKNVLLVMPDAEPDATVRAVMGAAFGCAGQRCMAGALLVGIGAAADPLRQRMVAAMDQLRVEDTLANPGAEMGPVIDGRAQERIGAAIGAAAAQGIEVARDGRQGVPKRGFFVGPTLLDQVEPQHDVFGQEVFGPVLSMLHPPDLPAAIEWCNRLPFGNGASIFTSNGAAAREFSQGIQCGMVGINLGVPAPMAQFSFSGWNGSFYGDLHVQGMEGVYFYTRQKTVLTRWGSNYGAVPGWWA